jgi:uncharacterized membrane protein
VSGGNASSSESYTGTERILAFSDGVFAIAITLLVLDLVPPRVGYRVVQKLLDAWPNYLSYARSFFIIGILWASHHQMFTQIKRSNHVFLLINIVFLMWVAALPFPTALLAEGLSHYDAVGRQAAVAIYTSMFLVGALLFNLEWWYAISHGRLLGEGADPEAIKRTPPRGLRPASGPQLLHRSGCLSRGPGAIVREHRGQPCPVLSAGAVLRGGAYSGRLLHDSRTQRQSPEQTRQGLKAHNMC